MKEQLFASLPQSVTRGLSRRASFATIGAAGLTALVTPLATEARNRKRCKQATCPNLEEMCAPKVEACIDTITALCPQGGNCSRIVNCCARFETCDVGAFALCMATPAP